MKPSISGSRSTGASNAFAWGLLNTVVSRLGTLGIGIVLARMLGPESFGTFAVAMVALMAVLSFNELGVSLAIVRWPEDPAKIVPTVNTISVAGAHCFALPQSSPRRRSRRQWAIPAPPTWCGS